MGKLEEESVPAEGDQAAIITPRREWYRRLLQAMVFSRPFGYHRLAVSRSRSSTSRKSSSRVRVARLGNKRPAFRLRTAASRMRWRWLSLSPLSLLAKLRNAYVNLMLSASAKLASSSEGLAFGGPLSYSSHPFLFSAASHHYPSPSQLVKQHDKILMELYMSMAQHQFTPSSC